MPKLIASYNFQKIPDFDPGDGTSGSIEKVRGLSFSNQVGVALDTHTNRKVLIFRGHIAAGTFQRWIEIEKTFLGGTSPEIRLGVIRGAVSNRFSIGGSLFDLELPDSGEELVIQYAVSGTSSWVTSSTFRLDISNSDFEILSVKVNLPSQGQYKIRIAQRNNSSTVANDLDHFAFSEIGVYSSAKSGYLTNPVRTIIRESDYRTGSYPSNIRVGDPDFRGNSTFGMSFDDTKSIDFVSPFSKASIEILGVSSNFHKHWIGLTGSHGGFKKDFEFVIAESGSEEGSLLNSEKIYLGDSFSSSNIFAASGIPTAGIARNSLPEGIAESLVRSINLYRDKLKIEASAIGRVVHLKGLHPVSGQNNNIVTGTYADALTPVKITPFSFSTRSKVNFPSLLSKKSPYSNQNISNPNILPDLEGFSESRKGIVDHGVHFTPGENISPFDESRITIESNQFYSTGTDPGIIKNFESPLKSKTQIVLNLNSSNGLGTHLFYSTGSPGPLGTHHSEIAGKYGSGFSYWNDSLNRWEMVNAIAGNEPRWNHSSVRLKSVRGFSQPMFRGPTNVNGWHRILSGDSKAVVDEKLLLHRSVANPVLTSGFPTAAQYNATGSQCIVMSNYISSPFLLEKIRVEIAGNFGIDGSASHSGVSRMAFRKFFILAQSTNGTVPHTAARETVRIKEVENGSSLSFTNQFKREGKRELVAYARICLGRDETNYKGGSVGSFQAFKDSFEKYIEYTSSDVTALGVTSSFSMDLHPKLALNADNMSFFNTAETTSKGNYNFSLAHGNFVLDENSLGAADLLGNPSGRQLGTSLDIADLDTSMTGTVDHGAFSVINRSEYSKTSPYLLFPEDRIVFGWENIPEVISSNADIYNADRMVDRLKSVKVTLFGSLVRDGKEYHNNSNQPLTSDGIHEAILGSDIVDQWDVEPITILSGSTRDALFSGDMFSNTTAQRGRRGSISAGDGGTTGSLTRNVQFYDRNVIYSDSRVPSLGSALEVFAPTATGSQNVQDASGGSNNDLLILSNRANSPTRDLLKANNLFGVDKIAKTLSKTPNIFPMAGSSGDVSSTKKLTFPGIGVETTAPFTVTSPVVNVFGGGNTAVLGLNGAGNSSPEVEFVATPAPVNVQKLDVLPPAITDVGDTFKSEVLAENVRALNAIVFAAPLVVPDLGGLYKFPIIPFGRFLIPEFRGLRFGFSNIYPTTPVYHFKRDSYGQVRDLIESPPEAKMNGLVDLADEDNGQFVSDQNAEDPPVKVIFTSRGGDANISPLDTNSQNLSQFATSSEPFFDGLSKERDIVNFPPPDLTDRTTIEEAVQQIIDGEA